MKLLAVNSARAIWLVPTAFLNPRGRYLIPIAIELMGRYRFATTPDAKDLSTRPLEAKFENGSFNDASGNPIYASLSLHEDGLIAETRSSTDESERFLDEVLSALSTEYQLPHYKDLGVQRLYVSEVVVEMSMPANIFSNRLLPFVEKLRGGSSNNPGVPMDLIALAFGPDPTVTKKTASFRIERLVNSAFNENRYVCSAPLRTSEHLELLSALEG